MFKRTKKELGATTPPGNKRAEQRPHATWAHCTRCVRYAYRTAMRVSASPEGEPLYQGYCSCGWAGDQWARRYRGHATVQANQHHNSAAASEAPHVCWTF